MNLSQPLLIADLANLISWMTPVWLLGMGVALGLVMLFVLWGICAGISRIPFVVSVVETPKTKHIVALSIAGLTAILIVQGLFYWLLGSDRGISAVIFNPLFAVIAAAVIGLICGYSVVTLVSPRTVEEVPLAVNEGPLLWILTLAICVTVVGGAATFVVVQPVDMLASLADLPKQGTYPFTRAIAQSQTPQTGVIDLDNVDEQEIAVAFDGRLVKSIEFRSEEPLAISTVPYAELDAYKNQTFDVSGTEPEKWFKGGLRDDRIPEEPISKLYVRNLGQDATELKMSVVIAPKYPQVSTIVYTSLGVVAVFLLYVLQRSAMPKLFAVALATCKSEIAQPLFLIFLIVGAVLLIVFVYLPYNTFGEDIKMLKDSGLTLILVVAIFQAIWAASKSVADEIEGRTALTVLSKPIGRREFILGKFLGIAWTLALMFLILGTIFIFTVAYKPVYDAYEGGGTGVPWEICHQEMVLIVPGLMLAFMEALVMAAISIALSTRLSWIPNFLTCVTIYILGHLTPLMVQSSLNEFEIVTFVARLVATVFPVLDHFNIQAAVAGGAEVPFAYLGWAALYCLIYITISMLFALVLFEDRDLA